MGRVLRDTSLGWPAGSPTGLLCGPQEALRGPASGPFEYLTGAAAIVFVATLAPWYGEGEVLPDPDCCRPCLD